LDHFVIPLLTGLPVEFSESSLGRLLQALQLYILATFVLIIPFYGFKRSDESSDISPAPSRRRRASFQALNPRYSISTAFFVSPRTTPSFLPTTAVPSTRPTLPSRNAPDRISTWIQRNIQVPNRPDPLQARLWNANETERDVEPASPSPNAVPTADDSPLDARFTGKPLTIKWLDPAYNHPRDDRNLTITPEGNSGPSQEITLPTKTRAGSLILSGRQIRIPPSPIGPPPLPDPPQRPLPPIPPAATAATRPTGSFDSSRSPRMPRARVPPSWTQVSYFSPSRRPVSDGYPISLTSAPRNAAVPRRGPPLKPPSRPNVEEGAPARPATWATQDAFAQIDAFLRDGLRTPIIVEQRSSSGSSRRNSYDSGLARLRKEQEELDRSIAELGNFASSHNDSYFTRQQYLAGARARRPLPTLKIPDRGSGCGDGQHGFCSEAISSSGVSNTCHGTIVPKSPSHRSEFSISYFPSPPTATSLGSGYDNGSTERTPVITVAANAPASSLEASSSGPQGAAAKAPPVRKKRPLPISVSSYLVPGGVNEEEKEKEQQADWPTTSIPQAPPGEEVEFQASRSLRQTPDDRRLARLPSTFWDSVTSSVGGSPHVAQIVSSYSKRSSDGSTIVGQGALKTVKQLDVTSFIGGKSYHHYLGYVLTMS
jgi:hypothetical protein